MHMTRHAEQRRAQRNIPMEVVEAIYAFGRARSARGAMSFILDHNSIVHASDGDRGVANRLTRYVNTYLIVGENERIVTAARAKRRLRNQ
jgi:CRISPR/Cas system-associated endonuclease Cas1